MPIVENPTVTKTRTRFVRPVDWDNPTTAKPSGYKGHLLYYGEGCAIIASLVPPGEGGPAHHIHPASDQTYFVYEGEVSINLGGEVHTAPKNSVVHIPAGTPHHNWNAADQVEIHLEVVAPGVAPAAPAIEFADESVPWSGTGHYTRTADEERLAGPSRYGTSGMATDWMVNRESAAGNASMYLAQVPPGGSGPSLHLHPFDQFYFILEGTMGVQVAQHEYEVGPETLVVLPAGVPHRQWNAGDVPERHVAILVPEPDYDHSTEDPWDFPLEMTILPTKHPHARASNN